MNRRSGMGHKDGFTVLEVLIAFIILALLLGVALRVFSMGIRTTSISDRYAWTAMLAQSMLASLGTEDPLEIGTTRGVLPGNYVWEITVASHVDKGEVFGAHLIPLDVKVSVASPEGETSTLSTLRLGAAPNE